MKIFGKKVEWYINKLLNGLLIFCGIIVIVIFLQLFCWAFFKVPSDSMEPSLQAGDNIVVSKLLIGGRIFDVWDAVQDKEVKISRIPGFGKISRNDVLVFNFPYPGRWDSIGLDVMKFYVKRCVALPGDTFEIDNAHYRVHGCEQVLGNMKSQRQLEQMIKSGLGEKMGIVMKAYPNNDRVDWTIQNFGPFYIPAKGDSLEMNMKHFILYKNVIEWEQKKKLSVRGDTILLNDSLIEGYRFMVDYYFVAGDKTMNSQDSRYWGLLPEPFIVGKTWFIWKSVDIGTDKIRWNRVLKKIE
ncbi:signal peptidase I [Bacteroides oleiciplenus]|nr:signal peptidase I [Bacteroides oleiciplenus]